MSHIFAHGIHAATGEPLLGDLTLDDIAQIALGNKIDENRLADLAEALSSRDSGSASRGPVAGVDASILAEAGWGVIFAANLKGEERKALAPLLEMRKNEAGDLFKECSGSDGLLEGESKEQFLLRHKAASTGPVEPRKMPYYLLLVGSPEEIPFEFQYEMDFQYAVGRIHFDTPDEYHRYARAVVAAEAAEIVLEPRAAFVGVQNCFDGATETSSKYLVKPLADFFEKDQKTWSVEKRIAESATRADLIALLKGSQTPALLFTASHGVIYDAEDPEQHLYQGALLMEDYVKGMGKVKLEQCFTGDDVKGLNTTGMISFHFACFSCGTPAQNNFYRYTKGRAGVAQHLSKQSFLSALPKRLLSNGTLATIGHIDSAFASTFTEGASTAAYQSALKMVAEGKRIGLAMDAFNLRYGELSIGLTQKIEKQVRSQSGKLEDLARMWLENNDARNFVILGDPAVKLPLEESKILEREQQELAEQMARLKERASKIKKR